MSYDVWIWWENAIKSLAYTHTHTHRVIVYICYPTNSMTTCKPASVLLFIYEFIKTCVRIHSKSSCFTSYPTLPLPQFLPLIPGTVLYSPLLFSVYEEDVFKHMVPYLLPLVQLGLTGSIYLTVAIALERYTTVCHPFFKVPNQRQFQGGGAAPSPPPWPRTLRGTKVAYKREKTKKKKFFKSLFYVFLYKMCLKCKKCGVN